ncbi:MAG: SdiA-regulated domain-containing protein [Saprospiraceae bacterium]|nr:SdiA-regulated domain-containing protein [Saprospiraceae bacterium]
MDQPVQVVALDHALREISGLAYHAGMLYALQDEDGRVFQLDPSSGDILRDDKFWKDGDFEGIEVSDTLGIALKSNGNLYLFNLDDPDDDETRKVDSGLSNAVNFEGLGYDQVTRQLLLAAKRNPDVVRKEIYALDIALPADTMALQQVTALDQTELLAWIMSGDEKGLSRFRKNLAAATYSFNPSGIAVHPLTRERFVLSSPVPQLLVLTDQWELRDHIFLDPIRFRQPEAICFDREGNLYIANEGQGARGNLLKFAFDETSD